MKTKYLLLQLVVGIGLAPIFITPNTAWSGTKSQVLSLAFAEINTGTISLPGQQDRFTFSGTIGQRFHYDAIDLDFEGVHTRLVSPSGAAVWEVNHSSDNGPFYLTETGEYTLVLDGNGEATGDYSFRMLNMSSALPLSLGVTVTNALDPQSQTLVYQVAGSNGQRLSATNVAVSSSDANWRLVSPAGQNLFHANIAGSPEDVTLPATGTYLLFFEGYTENIGTLAFQSRLSLVSNPSGATTGFGTLRSGNTAADQTNDFAYTAPAGLVVYLDSQTNDTPVSVYLIDPSGALIFGVGGTSDSGPYVLPRSGNYTLRVVGYDTGVYRLMLLNLSGSGATTLTSGTTFTQTLDPGFETHIYRFNGAVGQRFYYDALDWDFDGVSAVLLDANGSNVHIGGNADSDVGPFTLAQPGTNYLILRSDAADNTMNYSFRLIDAAESPATALGLDTTINVVNDPGHKAAVYRFAGTNGQRLYFDFASTNDSGGNWSLYGPQNQNLFGNSPNSDGDITLSVNGPYLLSLGNHSSADPAHYSFRVVTPTTTTNALILGATVSGTLDEAGGEDRFTFTGSIGQRLYYDALDADYDGINVQLISPGGTILFISGNSDSDAGLFTLTENGTYTLLQKGNGDYTGDYSFRLIDVAQMPARAITFDTTVGGTNEPTTSGSVFRFTGTNGQRLFFDFAATNIGSAFVTLFGPENQNLNGSGYWTLYTDFEQTLPANGTYGLTVGNNSDVNASTTPFSFRVVTPTTTTNALTLGATVSGTLDEAGEEDRFTFTGSIGQRLYYDALDADYDAITVQLISPSGTIPFINGNSDNDAGLFTLTESGTYTLLQKGNGDYISDYSFRLIDVAQTPARAITFDTTVGGTNVPTTSGSVFRFTGTNGQRLFFDFAATNIGSAFVTLFGPENQNLNGNGYWTLYTDFEQTLPANGTYVLTVGNNSDVNASTSPFSFRVVTPTTTTNALTLGATVSGTLDEAGEEDRFTFTGSIGQRIYYDALDADNDAITVQLISPSGAIPFINGNSDTDAGLFTLTEAGTYTLLQKGNGDYTGNYSFRVLDLATSPAITYGVNVTNQINPQISAQLYRINGVAGQRIAITNLAASSANANWSLVGLGNNVLLSANIQDDLGEMTLLTTGTYALVVVGNQDFIGGLDYQFRVSLISSASGGTSGFDTIHADNTSADQTNSYSYTAPAGLPVYFDALTDSSPVTIQFIGPSGNPAFTIGGSSDAGPFFLPESGSYTLNVIGTDSGPFNFRLLNLNMDSAALSFGAAYTETLAPAFRTDIYRFTGTSGQRLYYDALENDNDYITARLFRPDGGNVFINGNSDNDVGLFTLDQSGNYFLAIINQVASDTVDYNFRLIDSVQLPAQVLALDTTVESTLDPGTSVDIYRVSGSAGQRIYFDGALTNNHPGYWQLFGPDNQYVGGNWIWADFEVILPANGTNLLVVFRNDGNTDATPLPYSIRAVTPVVATSALVLGESVTGTLNETGEDRFTFTGTAGQRLYYDSLEYDNEYLTVQLINPSGSIVFINGNSDSDIGPFTLVEPGIYTLVQRAVSEAIGDYNFRLIDIAQTPAQNLALDTSIEGTIDPGASADIYRVIGLAGQRIYFDGASTNLYPGFWQFYGTENQNLSGNWLYADFEFTLPTSGTNVLVVYKNDGGADPTPLPYFVRTVTPDRTTNAMTLGVTVTGTLDEPGEDDHSIFTGTAGQRLYYDALENDGESFVLQLISPSGTVFVQHNSESDFGPFTLTESGTYTLSQRTFTDVTGDYSFRLIDIAQLPATTVALDTTINGANSTGTAVTVYRFDGNAGHLLFFDGAPTNNAGSWNIFGPQNQILSGNSLSGDFEVTLTHSGTYVLAAGNNSDTNSASYNFQIIPGNHAPVLNSIGNLSLNEQSNLTFTAIATDLEAPNDQLTFSLDPGAPANATLNPVTGVFSWTPTETQGPGVYPVTIRVVDDGIPSQEDFETFNITVNEINLPPVLTVPGNQIVTELVPLALSATATDPDIPTNALTFALVSGPASLTVSPTGAINWTPSEAQGPTTNIVAIKVTDSNPFAVNATSLSVTSSFQIVVNESNVAPVLTLPANHSINELSAYSANATATDSDIPANALTFALVSGPASLTVSPAGAINWTPSEIQGSTTNVVTIKVTDTNAPAINATSLSVTQSYQIVVLELNTAPVLTLPANQIITELTSLSLSAAATDSDSPANPLTFALVSGPANLTVSPGGAINWTPSEAQGPTTNIVSIKVTDTNSLAVNATSLSVTNSFQIIVNESNTPPVLTLPGNVAINELVAYSANATAIDSDVPANALVFALVSGPANLTVSSDGAINWTPSEIQGPTTNIVTIKVTDTNPPAINATSLSVTSSYQIVVHEINVAPVLTLPANVAISEMVPYNANATATDSDVPANALTFLLVSGPTGFTVSPTGAINWTPGETQGPNTNVITIKVTDTNSQAVNATSLSVTQSYQIIIHEINTTPTLILPANQTINELTFYTNNVSGVDSDNPANALTFALVSAPTGVVLNASSGALTWTPAEAQGPSTNAIHVRVTDNNPNATNAQQISVTNSFVITVNEVNVAPVLTGVSNRTINVGARLTITNVVTDSDIPTNSFIFGLITSPDGAAVNSSNGVFTWRPGVARAGTTNNVEIIVTDSGTPPNSDTKIFTIIVNPLAPVTLVPLSYSSGLFQIQINGDVGPDYTIQQSGDLTNWMSLVFTNPVITPFTIAVTNTSNNTNQFYRALIAP